MILETKEFQSACKKILFAIDNKNASLLTETLELRANGTKLDLNVTNREYFVSASFNLPAEENITIAVNASLFLKLIAKVTTDTIEITKSDNYVKIKANGEYKLPIIFNNDVMLELPKIEINNVTNTMCINSSILHSIANYNSKELLRGVPNKPVQNYYYVDEQGAITFTQGACVNSFTLEKPVKLLLSDKVVKLLKLFHEDESVDFTLGQDAISEDVVQTKVRFKTNTITITAKLSDSGLVSTVPVSAIRTAANNTYSYSVVVNRDEMLQALNRILLFANDNVKGTFEFTNSQLTIYDFSKDNKEVVSIKNDCSNLTAYSMGVGLDKFKIILDGAEDDTVTINFGDKRQVVVKKQNICDITPEVN